MMYDHRSVRNFANIKWTQKYKFCLPVKASFDVLQLTTVFLNSPFFPSWRWWSNSGIGGRPVWVYLHDAMSIIAQQRRDRFQEHDSGFPTKGRPINLRRMNISHVGCFTSIDAVIQSVVGMLADLEGGIDHQSAPESGGWPVMSLQSLLGNVWGCLFVPLTITAWEAGPFCHKNPCFMPSGRYSHNLTAWSFFWVLMG
jgi:hypothetical protein